MQLLEQIEKDYQQAVKERKEDVVSVLRLLLAALKNAKIEKRQELDQQEVVKVIKSEIKKRNESIKEYEDAQRQDLADKEKNELEILKPYLPEQLSEDQVRAKVQEIISGIEDLDNFGQVMGKVMAELKDQADGALVKQIVEAEIKK